MPTGRRNSTYLAFGDELLRGKKRRAVPHEFVLDALAPLSPVTRPMFGCLAVYVEEKIVLILRDKARAPGDNGVWIATTAEHHETLRRELPLMQSILVLGKATTGWQVLPADAPDFEDVPRRACACYRTTAVSAQESERRCTDFCRIPRTGSGGHELQPHPAERRN